MKNRQRLGVIIGGVVVLIIAYFIADSFLFDGFKPKAIHENGFQAEFFAQQEIENKPAVIIIGGGQGGYYWGKELMDRGYVALSLPYMREEGLPNLMEEIPLEYFERAAEWLKEQPEVHPNKIILMGASRNAELALVIAAAFPELISGVIAYAPGAVSWSNTVLPFNSEELKPSWTYKGKAIPYLPMEKIKGPEGTKIETLPYWEEGLKKIDQYPEAIIPVEKITGNILLLSGTDDQIWPSALMSDMIEKRLTENNFTYTIENVQFEEAGHLLSRNIPSISSGRTGKLPVDGKNYDFEYGGTIAGDKAAHTASREKIFAFIQAYDSEDK